MRYRKPQPETPAEPSLIAAAPERKWSQYQEAIFAWFEDAALPAVCALVARARAGTGKTTTILEGVRRSREARAGLAVLVAAFNKPIAATLTQRLREAGARGIESKTLHSVGFGHVRRAWPGVRLDDDRKFRLARRAWVAHRGGRGTEADAPNVVVAAVVKLASLGKNVAPRATVAELRDLAVAFSVSVDNGWAEQYTPDAVAEIARAAMDLALERDGTISFEDMVFLPVVHRWTRPEYDLVVIDEAQDMNAAQLELARGVCRGRVAVVGDDMQAIYGFRGADSGALDRLKEELGARELPLSVTYRCARAIVAEARKLVPDLEAAPGAPEGEVASATERDMIRDARPGDFILSRVNAPLAMHCLAFIREGRAARIEGRDFGKTIAGIVRKSRAPDVPALAEYLHAWRDREVAKAAKASPAAAQARVDYLYDVTDTILALSDGLASVEELAARIEAVFGPEAGPAIVLSSVHKAKGLEADRVFVLADTLYCGGRRTEDQEERNIHYVAVTRARRALVYVRRPAPDAAAPSPTAAPARAALRRGRRPQ